ncbi:MAG: tyrosine-type recombinase/integrase [Firmicutes bacterium]|nr:tyrosine-type recombinase/integrase [Bacillota bacterium]
MKLPNSYGSVYKLPGTRRRPWAVRKTESWYIIDEATGKLGRKYKYIGYYATKAEALQALAEYNANPYDIPSDITFAEVYDKWSERKFEEISRSNINGYQASYKLCNGIESIRFVDIKLSHLQGAVDSSGKNYPTLKKLKILFNQLFDYAVKNEIIGKDKHIVEYVDIGKAVKSDKHFRFTDSEINTMWAWAEKNEYIQVILMLIYSGVRPGEMFNVKKQSVNLEEKSFYIEKGKNDNAVRKVPIHDKVFPFFQHWMQKSDTEYLITQLNGKKILFDTNHGQYTETYWKPLLTDMGILQYRNAVNEIKDHTPNDTRHTFTTMWKEKQLDEAMRRKIQGHSGKGIGEMVYTHFEFEKLRTELNKL